jgi:hypothetical protein
MGRREYIVKIVYLKVKKQSFTRKRKKSFWVY